ncbi:MAG: type II toxin-antitoxin system PemK/MazF family toxin [Caldilineaceae bacterium]|nr:type II toxin-antitoxin system PemK/MazF family toxin [Caldilineaceae bacterium]
MHDTAFRGYRPSSGQGRLRLLLDSKGKIRPCVIVTNNIYNARVPVIQVVPITAWSERKARIVTNVELPASQSSGLTKRSVADCLQTRPVDHRFRLVKVRGRLPENIMQQIDQALRIVFAL